MNNLKSIAKYNKSFTNQELHNCIINSHVEIESWFRKQWIKYPAPFYSSIDIRNSGFKIAPVDTNLFPAGFNNLDKNFEPLYISALSHALERQSVDIRKILLIGENHTRNQHYTNSLSALSSFIKKAGFEIEIASLGDLNTPGKINPRLKKINKSLCYESFSPDLIILNNDLSDGVPDILKETKQPILPDPNLGWTNRSKTIHFEYYSDVVKNFTRLLGLDSWLMEPLFRNCGEIDFKTKQGEDCMLYHTEKLFMLIKEKYEMYGIDEKPYIMIKADSGTYGMGIIQVSDINDLKNINRKQRTRMTKIKGGAPLNKVILQEGIYSNEKINIKSDVVEPVIYSFGSSLLGGFYRIHEDKDYSENLNSPGMSFHPISFNDACISPDSNQPIHSDTNKFYIYGVIARLAILAAAKELYNLDS